MIEDSEGKKWAAHLSGLAAARNASDYMSDLWFPAVQDPLHGALHGEVDLGHWSRWAPGGVAQAANFITSVASTKPLNDALAAGGALGGWLTTAMGAPAAKLPGLFIAKNALALVTKGVASLGAPVASLIAALTASSPDPLAVLEAASALVGPALEFTAQALQGVADLLADAAPATGFHMAMAAIDLMEAIPVVGQILSMVTWVAKIVLSAPPAAGYCSTGSALRYAVRVGNSPLSADLGIPMDLMERLALSLKYSKDDWGATNSAAAALDVTSWEARLSNLSYTADNWLPGPAGSLLGASATAAYGVFDEMLRSPNVNWGAIDTSGKHDCDTADHPGSVSVRIALLTRGYIFDQIQKKAAIEYRNADLTTVIGEAAKANGLVLSPSIVNALCVCDDDT